MEWDTGLYLLWKGPPLYGLLNPTNKDQPEGGDDIGLGRNNSKSTTINSLKKCRGTRDISLVSISAIAATSSVLLLATILLVLWLLFRRYKRRGEVPSETNLYYGHYEHQMSEEEGGQLSRDNNKTMRLWDRSSLYRAPQEYGLGQLKDNNPYYQWLKLFSMVCLCFVTIHKTTK